MKVTDITSIATDNLREKYLKENLVVTEYVPYLNKVAIAREIVDKTSFDADGHIRYNSPLTYLCYVLKLIENWTNIEIDTSRLADEYDDLNKTGVLDKIVEAIPESEKSEFDTIYHMVQDDLQANEMSVKHIFEEAVVKLGNGIGEFVAPLVQQLNKEENS